jgi:tetratricopeptide (TPR) repeat protein
MSKSKPLPKFQYYYGNRRISPCAIGVFYLLWLVFAELPATAADSLETRRANNLLRMCQFEPALHYADMAVVKHPNEAAAYAVRGKIQASHENFEVALLDLNKALEMNPAIADDDFFESRARCLAEAGNFKGAERDLRKALQKHKTWDRYKLLGELCTQQKKNDEAIRAFSEAIALDKTCFWVIKERAALLEEAHRYDGALADYARMIELKPTDAIGFTSRGRLYQKLGKKSLADKDFERAKKCGNYQFEF